MAENNYCSVNIDAQVQCMDTIWYLSVGRKVSLSITICVLSVKLTTLNYTFSMDLITP